MAGVDAAKEIAALCPYPVTLCNDATAACAAEFFFGPALARSRLPLLLPRRVHRRRRRARRLALTRAHRQRRGARLDADRAPRAKSRNSSPAPPSISWSAGSTGRARRLPRLAGGGGLDGFGAHLDGWIEEAARALAFASVAALSVVDFEAIVIDGAMPASVRGRLSARTAEIFDGSRPARALATSASFPARSAPTRARSAARRCR